MLVFNSYSSIHFEETPTVTAFIVGWLVSVSSPIQTLNFQIRLQQKKKKRESSRDTLFFGKSVTVPDMMHMTLYWGTQVTLLFSSWKTDSWLSYALTLLACFLFSVFYQNMEERRLRFKTLASTTAAPPSSPSAATPLLFKFGLGRTRWGNPSRIAEAMLFGVNSAIGYLLMLAIMSFNGGVFVAIVLGLSVGYYLFRSGYQEEVAEVENSCACS